MRIERIGAAAARAAAGAARGVAVALVALIAASNGSAQQPEDLGARASASMDSLSWLVGTWRGEAWMQFGDRRMTFESEEVVEPQLDGQVLVVHGRHRTRVPGSSESVVAHDALGVLSMDPAGGYNFRAYVADRAPMGGTFPFRREGDAWVWGFDDPRAGTVRYTIRRMDGAWVERGERRGPDGTWTEFYGMRVTRVGS